MIIISANTSSNVEILFQVCITLLKRQGRQKMSSKFDHVSGQFRDQCDQYDHFYHELCVSDIVIQLIHISHGEDGQVWSPWPLSSSYPDQVQCSGGIGI